MKTKNFIVTGMLGIALAGVIFTGCKKSSTEADTDATAAQDDANASFVMNDSKTVADGAAKGQANERADHGFTACGVARKVVDTNITIGSVTYTTDTLWDIAFSGTCVSPDGRTRKGHILVCWTGKGYFDSATTISETWKNYSVTTLSGNTIGVTGYRTLTNIGKDSAGDHSWSFNASLALTYSTGGSCTWNSSRTNILQYNSSLATWFYVITGSANGTSKSGVAYTLSITSPLYWTAYWLNGGWLGGKFCNCIEQGQVELTRTGKTYPLYLTFTSGLGKCACTATATINGNNYNIVLP